MMWKKIEDWLDAKMIPTWRIWWKLGTMRLGAVAAVLLTYLAAVPSTLTEVLNACPGWIQNSLPAWIGPLTLAILFVTRFWNQTHVTNAVQPAAPPQEGPEHGAE